MPNRLQNIAPNDMKSMANMINRNFQKLDVESVTKTFSGPSGNSIIQGRLPSGKYGQIYYDNDGVARILIGQAPDDGRMGIWISKEGQDVLTLLGG